MAQTAAFRPGNYEFNIRALGQKDSLQVFKSLIKSKHGCDFKGYGYTEKEPRLNLSSFVNEAITERTRPILQDFCAKCYSQHSYTNNVLVQCDGCCRGILVIYG